MLGLVSFVVVGSAWATGMTATIDCSSGVPDLSAGVNSVTANECQTQCHESCPDVATSDDLEDCLSNPNLKGCLYTVGNVLEKSVNACVNSKNKNAVVVVEFSGDSLYDAGDGTNVHDVSVALSLEDSTLFKSCANKSVKIGVSSTVYDGVECTYSGTPTMTASYSISHDTKTDDMFVPVKEALEGLWGSTKDAVVVIELQDDTCGVPEVEDAESFFNMSYQSGYIDAATCLGISDCYSCKAAGCHWCSWNRVVDTLLPDWLPDWDWVTSAKQGDKGRCGLNSAICRISAGTFDTCGAPHSLALLAAAALLPTLLV